MQLTSKQFTAKNKEVDDADLQAYLASSSDEEGWFILLRIELHSRKTSKMAFAPSKDTSAWAYAYSDQSKLSA